MNAEPFDAFKAFDDQLAMIALVRAFRRRDDQAVDNLIATTGPDMMIAELVGLLQSFMEREATHCGMTLDQYLEGMQAIALRRRES